MQSCCYPKNNDKENVCVLDKNKTKKENAYENDNLENAEKYYKSKLQNSRRGMENVYFYDYFITSCSQSLNNR